MPNEHSVAQTGFICLYPIGGMVGYSDGPDVVGMGGVRFSRSQIVSRDWKELGFIEDPVAAIREPGGTEDGDCNVFAIVTLDGGEQDPSAAASRHGDKALRHLLSCNPAWTRKHNRRPLVPGASVVKLLGFKYVQNLSAMSGGRTTWTSSGPLHEIRFDGFWWANSKSGFYSELDSLLKKSPRSPWEESLVSVSELLGAARLAATPWESFFHSMVGIERLLKKRNEEWRKRIPPALQTLFGWLSMNRGDWYAQELEKLYKLRNQLVHQGQALAIEESHAALADEVLYNCLSLGLKHVNQVGSLKGLLKEAALATDQKRTGLAPTALPNALVVYPA